MASAERWLVYCAAGFMMVALTGIRAGAQPTIKNTTAPRIQSVEGIDTFNAYCTSCHGPKAKGDGPAAMALKKAPADLTTITKRNGKFSAPDVEDVILGTRTMESHGSRDMPIWGPVFRSLAPDDAVVKLRVANLVNYLKSIQTP